MEQIILNEKDYYSKVYGGWMGKNIGGTLGAPMEGDKQLMNLTFYSEIFDAPIPNDDLDLQLVWLHALEQYGVRLAAQELGQEWLEHVFFPYDEYGYALTNLRKGLLPPLSGSFNNPFTNCMGSPIRSEIWAMVAPGVPGLAAWYAYQDAIVDHAGGEGVYGEMFFAAIESAAFIISNVDILLDIGLSCIPTDCRTYRAVKDLRKWHEEGKDWLESRELILKYYGCDNFSDAPQNIAFTILGWLYGDDFGDAIIKAVNCGYDTDCTGATLGAILGIIGGKESIPNEWIAPIGDKIAVSPQVKGFDAPVNLEELTQRTIRIAKKVVATWEVPVSIVGEQKTFIPAGDTNVQKDIFNGFDPSQLWNISFKTDKFLLPQGSSQSTSLEVTIDYGKEGPSIGKNQRKEIKIQIKNKSNEEWEGNLELLIPTGWNGPQAQHFVLATDGGFIWQIELEADDNIYSSYDLALNICREHDECVWNKSMIHFALIAATHWILSKDHGESRKVICTGNRIEFEKAFNTLDDGIYYAQTTLRNPKTRKVIIIGATASPITVKLDGEILFSDSEQTEFMPAYHRGCPSKKALINLPAGDHLMEIKIHKLNDVFDVYMIPVASEEAKKPGDFYCYTDILFI